MLDEKYIQNLTRYLGKKVSMDMISSNEIKIFIDWEINYILRKKENGFFLMLEERGVERSEQLYANNILEMKRKLALFLKEEKLYGKLREFEGICELDTLIKLACEYLDGRFYSINEEQADKIILKQIDATKYDLYIMNSAGEKRYIEREASAPDIFRRFYCEVDYLMCRKKKIDEYERVFGERLSYDEKSVWRRYRYLDYNNNM